MKIKIIQNGEPIKVFHESYELIYSRKAKTVKIIESGDIFLVEKRELGWKTCTTDDEFEEIHAIFYVSKKVEVL